MRSSCSIVRVSFRWLAAFLFIAAGINHFRVPRMYEAIMPPLFPQPRLLVELSGFFEVIGGGALLLTALRKSAGWGLIALLIAVFPANLWMAFGPEYLVAFYRWVLIARLPLQLLLIAWVGWVGELWWTRPCNLEGATDPQRP